MKKALLRIGRGYQILEAPLFRAELEALLRELRERGAAVVVVGPPRLDERYFPGSMAQLTVYESIQREVAAHAGCSFVPLSGRLREWDHFLADRFHPNSQGHRAIADILSDELSASIGI